MQEKSLAKMALPESVWKTLFRFNQTVPEGNTTEHKGSFYLVKFLNLTSRFSVCFTVKRLLTVRQQKEEVWLMDFLF